MPAIYGLGLCDSEREYTYEWEYCWCRIYLKVIGNCLYILLLFFCLFVRLFTFFFQLSYVVVSRCNVFH